MDDKELLDSIKENPAEFSRLFNEYYKQIFGYVLRRTGDFDGAADIAAETFAKAFVSIKRLSYPVIRA